MANKVDIDVQLKISKAMSSIRKLNSGLSRMVSRFNQNNSAVSSMSNKLNTTNGVLNKINNTASKLSGHFNNAGNSANRLKNDLKTSDIYAKSMAESATQISKALAGLVLGTQFIQAAETYGSAVNKLNNINAQTLGAAGTTTVNGVPQYSQATQNMTSQTLGKIYNSAQSARTNYGQMIGNIGKQAMLAGDAFDNNIDNVIKFNELLAKSYTISGATTEEQMASMTQLTQALGAGVLQGDELRSVREGATMAYQAIEKFAQKVYDTDESLKELGAEGKVTSDLVVAAILQNSDAIDQAMQLSGITVGQFWTMFKNSAFYAFSDTFKEFDKFLAKLSNSVVYETILDYITGIAKAATLALSVANSTLDFINQHAETLKPIIQALMLMLTVGLGGALAKVQINVIKTFMTFIGMGNIVNKQFLGIIAILGAVYGVISLVTGGALDSQAQIASALIATAGLLLAIKVMLLGFSNPILFIGGLAVSVLLGIIAQSIITKNSIVEGIAEVIASVAGAGSFIYETANWIGQNIGYQAKIIEQTFIQVCKNVKTIWDNLMQNLKHGWESFLNGMTFGKYEVRTPKVGLTEGVSGLGDLYDSVKDYKPTADPFEAFSSTKDSVYNKVVDALSNIQNIVSGVGSIDTSNYGLDYTSPDISDMLDNIGDTADNTDQISNDLQLVTQDLSFLKDLAELEWKKEFTTASINVSMTNNNNISDKNDIGDIATILKNRLQTELKTVASGTYS